MLQWHAHFFPRNQAPFYIYLYNCWYHHHGSHCYKHTFVFRLHHDNWLGCDIHHATCCIHCLNLSLKSKMMMADSIIFFFFFAKAFCCTLYLGLSKAAKKRIMNKKQRTERGISASDLRSIRKATDELSW